MQSKVGILNLGCPRNLVDSESILSRLDNKGYPIVDIDKADIAIVNTCAFIEDARFESIDAILDLVELKKEGRLKKIIVYGCLAQRYKEKLKKELPGIDAFVGRISLNHETPGKLFITPKHYAYLKVCDGCVNNCSYCVIPKIKGRLNSLDMDAIMRRIEYFDNNGVSEVNIIGQDITAYGLDLYGKVKLPEVLAKIAKKIKNIGWIRLLYLYPDRISEELLKLIKDEPRFCKYIDLPIQHINSRILKLMHRKIKPKDIRLLIDKVRQYIPDVAIRTSLITGFPSETEEEFKELVEFIEEVKFERLGAFTYSREEGTPAYGLKKQIPQRIKKERLNTLMLKQQEVSRQVNSKFLGKTIEILVDAEEGDLYLGRTQYDAPEVDGLVYIRSKKRLKAGEFVKVKITDTLEYDLTGEIV